MNLATAQGILGAETTPKGECDFTAQGGRRLRIQFGSDFGAFAKQCAGRATALKGIGNEAVACTAEHGREERLIGRVREKAFLITLIPADLAKIQLAAEIVAGNLY